MQPAQVRIVHVHDARASCDPAREAAVDDVLRRVGSEVLLERRESPAEARARCLEVEVDLIVVAPGVPVPELTHLLESLRGGGPPVIVLTESDPAPDAVALGWLRRGAADCIEVAALGAVLPEVARALLRRQRDERRHARGALEGPVLRDLDCALLRVGRDGRVREANRPAEALLGELRGGLLGRHVLDWFASPAGADAPIARSLEKGERVRGAEAVLRRADGERISVAVFSGPAHDEAGNAVGAVALFQDLSELRRLERQLFQREKMASIGQLAAGVAHEINNPAGFIDANLGQMDEYVGDLHRLWRRVTALLDAAEAEGPSGGSGPVALALEALREEAARLDAAFVLDDLRTAIRESREGAERIRHIVQDLRAFARDDAEERVYTDVNQSIDSTANIVWSMMKHAVVLKKDYGELPPILSHPGRLKQIVMNLLMNAYQAIVARRGVSGELGEIAIRTARAGEQIVVEVHDDGTGIAPEDMSRIFDPFFTTQEPGAGTGLGLSTVFHLVSALGGRVEAESPEEGGATFRVLLPTAPASAPGFAATEGP